MATQKNAVIAAVKNSSGTAKGGASARTAAQHSAARKTSQSSLGTPQSSGF